MDADESSAGDAGGTAKRPEPRRFTDEVLSDEMAAVLRAKTLAQRLRIADELWTFMRTAIRANLARRHPEWTAEELDRAVAGRMSRGAF